MTTMIAEVYEALKDAGASDEKAKAAAEVLAEYRELKAIIPNLATKTDLEKLAIATKTDLERVEARIDTKISAAKTDLLKWLIGLLFLQAGFIVTLIKLL